MTLAAPFFARRLGVAPSPPLFMSFTSPDGVLVPSVTLTSLPGTWSVLGVLVDKAPSTISVDVGPNGILDPATFGNLLMFVHGGGADGGVHGGDPSGGTGGGGGGGGRVLGLALATDLIAEGVLSGAVFSVTPRVRVHGIGAIDVRAGEGGGGGAGGLGPVDGQPGAPGAPSSVAPLGFLGGVGPANVIGGAGGGGGGRGSNFIPQPGGAGGAGATLVGGAGGGAPNGVGQQIAGGGGGMVGAGSGGGFIAGNGGDSTIPMPPLWREMLAALSGASPAWLTAVGTAAVDGLTGGGGGAGGTPSTGGIGGIGGGATQGFTTSIIGGGGAGGQNSPGIGRTPGATGCVMFAWRDS